MVCLEVLVESSVSESYYQLPMPVRFCPGTVMFVDDNQSFLDGLCLALDGHQAQQAFNSPRQALQYLQHHDATALTQTDWLSIDEDADVGDDSQSVQLNIPAIHEVIYTTQRFVEPAVVVVDYAMPEMNGLDFCRALKDKPVKKIMLTGNADLAVAVAGFNQGIIDQFVMKSALAESAQTLATTVQQLQWEYYQQLSQPMLDQLALQDNRCLYDAVFNQFFQQLCQQKDIVEFYLLDSSGSFLLADVKGNTYLLVVKSAADMDDYVDIVNNTDGAPSHIITALQTRQKIPYFHTVDDFATHVEHWDTLLYSADLLAGEQAYYYALLPMPQRYLSSVKNIVSLYDHQKIAFSALHKCVVAK